jgi:predicted ester cyclase
MTPDELKAKSRRFIDEIFNKRNLKFAEESLSDDFVEHSPYPPITGSDKQAAIDSFQAVLDSSDDIHAEIIELISDERRIAIRATYSGTDTGGFMPGIPPTGKRFEAEGIDVAEVDDQGKFSSHYGIPDAATVMQQLGLAPSGPPPA